VSADDIDMVAQVLDDMDADDPDEITADDLQRLHDALPRDPKTARVVNKALPYPWSEVFEYVSPSERQRGYWRTKPDRSQPRSEADAEVRERFAEANRATEGVEGTVERDGKEVAAPAAYVAAVMGDERFSTTRVKVEGRKAMRKLRDVLGL
jgi:hypothetical protein